MHTHTHTCMHTHINTHTWNLEELTIVLSKVIEYKINMWKFIVLLYISKLSPQKGKNKPIYNRNLKSQIIRNEFCQGSKGPKDKGPMNKSSQRHRKLQSCPVFMDGKNFNIVEMSIDPQEICWFTELFNKTLILFSTEIKGTIYNPYETKSNI